MTTETAPAARRGSLFDLLAAMLCFGFIVVILGSLVIGGSGHAVVPTAQDAATHQTDTPPAIPNP